MADTMYRDDDDSEYERKAKRLTELREILPDLIELDHLWGLPSPPETPLDDGRK